MKNAVGITLPEAIPGYGAVKPYNGAFANLGTRVKTSSRVRITPPGEQKLLSSLEEAIHKSGLRNGMTISFHHHLRGGDLLVNMVMKAVAGMGFKDIHLAASGLYACHAPLVRYIDQGVITQISTCTLLAAPIAEAVAEGRLEKPVVLTSHGGRPRAIESGDLPIDVAFIAAPSCDEQGNLNGIHGPAACGYLSHAYVDALHAGTVVAVTDHLVAYPNCPVEISQDQVDYVVKVDAIGAPTGPVPGSSFTLDPVGLQIAADAASLVDASGLIRPGMSLQTGAGGILAAVTAEVGAIMRQRGIVGSFGLGGIHSAFVQLLDEGLFRALLDVQCYDMDAIASAARNENHMALSASAYANPHAKGCIVHNLDTAVLGADEIDLSFNANLATDTTGAIKGGPGSHSDAAAGATLTILVGRLTNGNTCLVRDQVTTVITPGETVDALVTDQGIAINPARRDLFAAAQAAGLPVVDIAALKRLGEEQAGPQLPPPSRRGRVVAVVEYRDGTVLDLIHQVNKGK